MKLLFDLDEQQRIMDAIGMKWPWYNICQINRGYEDFVKRAKAEVEQFIRLSEKTRDEPTVWTGR